MHQKGSKIPHEEIETYSRDFYDIASEIWKTFTDPALDDIKNSMLAIIAKLINKLHQLEEDSLATALYNMLRMLVEKKKRTRKC